MCTSDPASEVEALMEGGKVLPGPDYEALIGSGEVLPGPDYEALKEHVARLEAKMDFLLSEGDIKAPKEIRDAFRRAQ